MTERRNGFYYINGEAYPSVTTILDALAKPALIPWAARMGARAALTDPTMSENDAPYAIYQVSGSASVRGQKVHWFCERYGTPTAILLEELPKDYRGYAEAYVKWDKDFSPKVLENELGVHSKSDEHAGRLDKLVEINGEIGILDIKTGKAIYPSAALQTAAYKKAVEEMGLYKVARTWVLLLKEDGNYQFELVDGDYEVFLAARDLWIWLNKDKYKTRNIKIRKRSKKEVK